MCYGLPSIPLGSCELGCRARCLVEVGITIRVLTHTVAKTLIAVSKPDCVLLHLLILPLPQPEGLSNLWYSWVTAGLSCYSQHLLFCHCHAPEAAGPRTHIFTGGMMSWHSQPRSGLQETVKQLSTPQKQRWQDYVSKVDKKYFILYLMGSQCGISASQQTSREPGN